MRDEMDMNDWSKLTNRFFHSSVLLSLNNNKKNNKSKMQVGIENNSRTSYC